MTDPYNQLPYQLKALTTWLVWRLLPNPDPAKKPLKVPFYANGKAREGGQGSPEDLAALCSFDEAVRVASSGRYNGVGLAMHANNGIVALDFDNCVHDGAIDPAVREIVEGTYSEFSPSGTGIRAFFKGACRDRKDHNTKGRFAFPIEFFHAKGYVTVTGRQTPDCLFFGWGLADLNESVEALYRQRFDTRLDGGFAGGGLTVSSLGAGVGGGLQFAASHGADSGDWFANSTELKEKVGLSIHKARVLLESLDPDCGYDEWLKTGQSLHYEFDGCGEALEAWKDWSRQSSDKYPGDKALDSKWHSFGAYVGQPIKGSYLLRHAKDASTLAKYEAVAHWKAEIAACNDEMQLREKLCPQISKDNRLTDVDRESIAQRLLDAFKKMGTKLTIAFCRKLVAPAERLLPTVKQKRPLTEFGNCDRMLDRYGESLMYVPETHAWYVWTGIYWRRSTTTDVEHYAKETVRGLVDEVEDHEHDLAEFFEFCKYSQQAKMVKNMVMLASSDPRVMVPASELDKHKALLCVQNGVVNLQTGELMEPDQAYRMTKVCACDYKPGTQAPLFKKVLMDVFFNDAQMCEFFMRLIGYSAIGNPIEDVLVIPYGNGSNGKSTVFNTIKRALGTYAKACSPDTFVHASTGSGAGGPREDLVRLQGARFVYVAEPDEGAELREGAIKGMTGGDAIPARAPYAPTSVEIEPSWVPFMPTNHKPIVKGSDNGIWRRIVLLPFTRNFESDPHIVKDEGLQEKLAKETEGVLAMIVFAAGVYLSGGLALPESVRRARDEYRSQMDLLAEWIEERCETGEGYSERIQALWESWQSFAGARGVLQYVRSSPALAKRLDQRFPNARDTRGNRVRLGIRLKVLDVNPDDWKDGFFQ